jgi:hypothetical protein
MPVSITPNQSAIQAALRSFLISILPTGIEVLLGQQNRVPEPEGANFVVFTPILRNRISTNIDAYVDAAYTGAISGQTLTITAAPTNSSLQAGSPVYGANISLNTVITALGTGSGGAGTYTVNNAQSVASGPIYSGFANMMQPTQQTFQIDVHGPLSADYAQTISTLFRDNYAAWQFAGLNNSVSPLYADDPKQVPFVNAEDQIETRWVINAVLQINQTVTVLGQQFATELEAELYGFSG